MNKQINPLAIAIICALAMLIIWGLWIFIAYQVYPNEAKIPDMAVQAAALRGQLGDMFGGINSVFTALLLGGSFYTIYLQHNEIKNIAKQAENTKIKDSDQIQIMAYTALINARTATLTTRMRIIENSLSNGPGSEKTNRSDSMVSTLRLQQFNEASNDFNEISRLSKEIEKILSKYQF